ncbi:hypothetical protein [Lysinibacillus sp. 54212]|uniref:hypothetical protein n=1 Tax=Lysinibacillus sp. 54212 TaxID=3119829 RepID=UPI003FA608F3
MKVWYSMNNFELLINQLRNGEIKSVDIKKSDFLSFREILIKDDEFKHFRGEAKQGGNIVFTFLQNPRS